MTQFAVRVVFSACLELCVLSRLCFSQTELLLPVIVKAGEAPVDVLTDDLVVPARTAKVRRNTGSGSIQREISNNVPLPFYESGEPGNIAQFRGLGRSAEDTSVQTLGVPLNSPQGGGFDLTVFPQFLWSSYSLQLGPSLSTFDPRAVSGTLSLVPWTVQKLTEEENDEREFLMHSSSSGVLQFSVGFVRPRAWASILGMSLGKLQGPSGALGINWGHNEKWTGSFHLLATYLEAENPGSQSHPTPNARSSTARLIPIVQLHYRGSSEFFYKTSIFSDGTYLKSDDPDSQVVSRDRAMQIGTENEVQFQNWRFGAGLRLIRYYTDVQYSGFSSVFEAPEEAILNLQGSRLFGLGDFFAEPTVRGVGVSRIGLLPECSFGLKQLLFSGKMTLFSRTSFSRRIPSLADRYYKMSLFRGNPDLRPERDWTQSLGVNFHLFDVNMGIQLLFQRRFDAQTRVQVSSGSSTVENVGFATVASLLSDLDIHLSHRIRLNFSIGWIYSKLDAVGSEFPYIPRLTGLGSLTVGPAEKLDFSVTIRTASSAYVGSADNRIAGYGYIDLSAQWEMTPSFSILGRVENIFDRRFELIHDFPVIGRTVSASVQGRF